MIERIEGVEAELHLNALREADVLVQPDVRLIHVADANVAPARRDGSYVVAEILVLDAGPGGVRRDVGVLRREPEEVGAAPLVKIGFSPPRYQTDSEIGETSAGTRGVPSISGGSDLHLLDSLSRYVEITRS